jgi:sucrose phosphorylase
MELLARSGVGRDINRHFYTNAEIEGALARPVVQSLMELIRFRNTNPAFDGDFVLLPCSDTEIVMEWKAGRDFARLEVDLREMAAVIEYSSDGKTLRLPVEAAPPARSR